MLSVKIEQIWSVYNCLWSILSFFYDYPSYYNSFVVGGIGAEEKHQTVVRQQFSDGKFSGYVTVEISNNKTHCNSLMASNLHIFIHFKMLENAWKTAKFTQIPCIFPYIRVFGAETGSLETATTATTLPDRLI